MLTSSKEAAYLRDLDIIIVDEASMIPGNALQCINRLLKDITNTSRLFGGKVLVFGGDYRQVLPVISVRIQSHLLIGLYFVQKTIFVMK